VSVKRSILTVDSVKPILTEQRDLQELVPYLPQEPVLSSQQINWQGLALLEFNHSSYRTSEHVNEYHLIAISLSRVLSQELRIDGQKYHGIQNIGEISIVPAELTRSATWTGNAEFILLTLSSKFVQEVAGELINPHIVELLPQHAIQDPLIYQSALSLRQDIQAGHPTGKLFGESVATMLVSRLLQKYAVHRPKQLSTEEGLSNYVLRNVLEYIQTRLDQDLSIADLAEAAGMSLYYFIRLFKKSMHITPRQYIIQQRVERAKMLLRSRELSISEISGQCGFTNQSHLTNVFHQLTKTTPKAYRQSLQ
jgi:AraC family transcriptional regulator